MTTTEYAAQQLLLVQKLSHLSAAIHLVALCGATGFAAMDESLQQAYLGMLSATATDAWQLSMTLCDAPHEHCGESLKSGGGETELRLLVG